MTVSASSDERGLHGAARTNKDVGGTMRVTDYYQLDRTQATVDFVNVETSTDNPVFIDPRAIRLQHGELEEECAAYLISFFTEVLDAIHRGENDRVRELMSWLREPNETHLGYSRGRSRGRGLSGMRGNDIADAISGSRAARTGLLQDLEDTALLVPGVDKDLISDMTTQIIRKTLIDYTGRSCLYYGIPMEEQASGSMWDPDALEWREEFVKLPRTPEGKLLLVPKTIVRVVQIFNKDDYFRDYLFPFLETREIEGRTELVKILKNGRHRVTKKALIERYGDSKPSIVEQTLQFDKKPLDQFRAKAGEITSPPLTNEELTEMVGGEPFDFAAAYDKLMAIAPGNAGATIYHRAVEELLTAIFYPELGNMRLEEKLHDGRKRVDIMYDNVSTIGFFNWLNRGYRCPLVPIECKNYGRDIANPELDQMIGRFSDLRGQFGIIVCRKFEDKQLFIQRCKDTAHDRRGFIIPLDDEDLSELASTASRLQNEPRRERRFAFPLLRERFNVLIL
jgi:hypothetical protein